MSNPYGIEGSHVFITGGAGFIGTTLAARLADANRITLYDNLHNNALQSSPVRDHPNVRLVQGDVLDLDNLRSALSPDVEYCIHCAAIAGVDTVIKNPLKTLEVNILGVFNVFRAAADLGGLKRIVDFSTSEVFGAHAYNVDEFTINPSVTIGEARWTYAISKLSGEFIAHAYHEQFGLPTVTIRPFNVYGPNQVGVGAIHHFVVRAVRNEDLFIHDDGSQIRAWCYVDDFVHGVLLTLSNEIATGRSYNIGNPRSTVTTYNLAKMVLVAAGSDSQMRYRKMGFQDVALRIPNIDSARRDLGFEPQIELDEGLRRTVAWYREKLAAA
ncbi:MAG: NAD-dependent epimerase/dehydratase family protein [Gammaproteobacteria bacterium]|nr:NAD-dependent epimerase/dehydratase family protein [Gammaproteobacteria bacterium]